MLLGTKKTLHDHITEILLGNSKSVSQIQDYLSDKRIFVTIQGIYKTLRELIKEEVIVKQKKTYFISNVWREKLEKIVSQRPPFKLSERERTVYHFNKLENLDMFWKHTIIDIQNELEAFPVFHANAHNFWYLVPGRYTSELEYQNMFSEIKKYGFTLIGGVTVFDKSLKKNYSHEYQHYHFNNRYPFNRRDHLSVIGPYIIITRVSVTLARISDKLYETCFTEDELAKKLEPEFRKHGAVTMTVEHNDVKAKRLRKKLAKDFYIPREVREKFELF